MENSKNFSIYTSLPDVLKIYNDNIHSTTKFRPIDIFGTTDKKIIKKVIANTKNAKKKFKNKVEGFSVNTKCLLCENFILKGNTIKYNKLKKKGKYNIPCIIIGNSGATDYKISFPINYKSFSIDEEYYVDYHLIIECEENIWDKILLNMKHINDNKK